MCKALTTAAILGKRHLEPTILELSWTTPDRDYKALLKK